MGLLSWNKLRGAKRQVKRSSLTKSSLLRAPRLGCEPLESRAMLSLLGLVPATPQFTYDSNGHIAYTASAGTFDLTATPLAFKDVTGPPHTVIAPRDLAIHIVLDGSGNFVSGVAGDDVVINGTVDPDGIPAHTVTGTLLTGEVSQFGFLDSGGPTDTYDLRFTPTGGLLQSYFAGKDLAMTITSENSTFTNDFTLDFSGGAKGTIGVVPPLLSSLSGFVYNDANNDGVFQGTESPIAGATVTLTGTNVDGGAINISTTTLADGSYSFTGLRPGTYTIVETQPVGYLDGKDTIGTPGGSTANDVFSNINLGAGINGVNNNFGELLSSSIAGNVYYDANNDGVFQGTESPISGVSVSLTGTDDLGAPVNLSTSTLADGSYAFTGLRPGTYTLTETQPAGYLDGKDTIGTPGSSTANDVFSNIILGAGVNGVNNNFGELLASSIGGNVYVDANNDGVFQGTESPIAGATVTLTGTDDLGNPVSASTTTSGTGAYSFTGLRPGTYTLTETQPAGYLDGKDTIGTPGGSTANDIFSNISLGAGVNGVNNNFGELLASSLAGFVYSDANNDGVFQGTEAPISGVTVKLTGTDDLGNPVSASTTTSGTGAYSFTSLRPGTYTLTETQPIGYLDGKDTIGTPGGSTANDVFSNISLGAGVNGVNNNFGELLSSSIAGNVYYDANNDGVFQGTESPISGVTVKLTGTDDLGNPVSLTTTTSGTGAYSFTGLRPGTYKLTETQPAGYLDGKDTIGTPGGSTANDVFSNIVLGAGVNGVNNNFGELLASSIAGFVYVDANNDGVFQGTETPIAGATVKLTGTNDLGAAVSVTATTSPTGAYSFTGLRPGTYTIAETQPAGYLDGKDTIGTPGGSTANDVFSNIVLGAGVNGVNNNFGELPITGVIKGTKYTDVTGNGLTSDDTPLGGVQIYLDTNNNGVYNSGEPVTTTAANGTYAFTGLAAGTYNVREVVPTGMIRTAPTLSDHYTVCLATGATSSGNDFANAETCDKSILTNIVYIVNGTTVVSDLRGNTNEGDTVEVSFTVQPGFDPHRFTLVSYTAPGATFVASQAAQQQIFDIDTGVFTAGTYTLTVTIPHSFFQIDFVCGSAIDHFGPENSNIFYSAQNRLFSADNDGTHAVLSGGGASLTGFVYVDSNSNGQVDLNEHVVAGTVVKLTGTTTSGASFSQSVMTDTDGMYLFDNLPAGTYSICETQALAYTDGADTLGSLGGTKQNDKFVSIAVGANAHGVNYNFAEQQVVGATFSGSQTATIAYWASSNGQALIKALNGSSNSTNLSAWLSSNFDNMYGANAGTNDLTGKTNAQVASYYQQLFSTSSKKLEAETLGLALAVYVTKSSLAGNVATSYGFTVSTNGLGASTVNVGSSGAAFGVSDSDTLTIMEILLRTNARAKNGVLWDTNGDASLSAAENILRSQALSLFDMINNT